MSLAGTPPTMKLAACIDRDITSDGDVSCCLFSLFYVLLIMIDGANLFTISQTQATHIHGKITLITEIRSVNLSLGQFKNKFCHSDHKTSTLVRVIITYKRVVSNSVLSNDTTLSLVF